MSLKQNGLFILNMLSNFKKEFAARESSYKLTGDMSHSHHKKLESFRWTSLKDLGATTCRDFVDYRV